MHMQFRYSCVYGQIRTRGRRRRRRTMQRDREAQVPGDVAAHCVHRVFCFRACGGTVRRYTFATGSPVTRTSVRPSVASFISRYHGSPRCHCWSRHNTQWRSTTTDPRAKSYNHIITSDANVMLFIPDHVPRDPFYSHLMYIPYKNSISSYCTAYF